MDSVYRVNPDQNEQFPASGATLGKRNTGYSSDVCQFGFKFGNGVLVERSSPGFSCWWIRLPVLGLLLAGSPAHVIRFVVAGFVRVAI